MCTKQLIITDLIVLGSSASVLGYSIYIHDSYTTIAGCFMSYTFLSVTLGNFHSQSYKFLGLFIIVKPIFIIVFAVQSHTYYGVILLSIADWIVGIVKCATAKLPNARIEDYRSNIRNNGIRNNGIRNNGGGQDPNDIERVYIYAITAHRTMNGIAYPINLPLADFERYQGNVRDIERMYANITHISINDTCCICYNEVQVMAKTRCGHTMCTECISKCILTSQKCPFCRTLL